MIKKYQLPKQDVFRFLQIRHYITKSTTLIEHPEISAVEKVLFQPPGKVSVSLLYGVIAGTSTTDTQRIKGVWEKELLVNIDDETWVDIWSYAKKISICTRAKAIQLKIIHRIHISPNRRHSFNPALSPLCLKCKIEIGTLTHCLWSCHKLRKYWSDILSEFEKIFGMELEMDPMCLLLGLPSRSIPCKSGKRLYNILTFAARKNILLQWINRKE